MTRNITISILVSIIGYQSNLTGHKSTGPVNWSPALIPHEVKSSGACKPMAAKNWILFDSTSTKDFSESFKKKLTEDMLVKLCDILENKVSDTEFEFLLNIGRPSYKLTSKDSMVTKAFQLTTTNNYVFATAELSSIFAKRYNLTLAWSSPDFSNPLEIHRSDVTNKKVDFFWCNDFPKEKIISDLSPRKITTKIENGYKFDVVYYLNLFPDVTILFNFDKKPSKESLNEIKNEVKKFGDKFKTVFIHDLEEYKDYYIISINHNTIDFDKYSDKDFEKDINNLDFLLKNINDNQKITDIKQIKFQ